MANCITEEVRKRILNATCLEDLITFKPWQGKLDDELTRRGTGRIRYQREWDETEDEYLQKMAGKRAVHLIARDMQRSVSSIYNRLTVLKISLRRRHAESEDNTGNL